MVFAVQDRGLELFVSLNCHLCSAGTSEGRAQRARKTVSRQPLRPGCMLRQAAGLALFDRVSAADEWQCTYRKLPRRQDIVGEVLFTIGAMHAVNLRVPQPGAASKRCWRLGYARLQLQEPPRRSDGH